MGVVWARVRELQLPSYIPNVGHAASYAAIGLCFIFAFRARLLGRLPRFPAFDPLHEAAFRAWAAIYTGAFLLGNNYDYRLIFLIPTVPLLMTLSRNGNSILAICAKASMITIVASLCYPWIRWSLQDAIPYGRVITYAIDESTNWTLFALLIFLQFCSLPDWMFKPGEWRGIIFSRR